jgi:thioesterase domain-containing protein
MSLQGSNAGSVARESLRLPTPYAAPVGEVETVIAGAFAEIFSVGCVGADDDFFDLGGDSVLAEPLSLLIADRCGRDFQLSSLMEYGTPRKIAALLARNGRHAAEPAPSAARWPPIFVVHGRNGFTLLKPDFRGAFAQDQRLHVFELPGIRGGHSHDAIEDIAAVYVGEIMETYPEGPVLLAGFCMGGLIAFEIASQLAAKGRPIRQLVLLDPALPKPARSSRYNRGSEWPPRATLAERLRQRLRRLLRLPAERRTPRQRRAFANDEVEFLRRLDEKARDGGDCNIPDRSSRRGRKRGSRPLPAIPSASFSWSRRHSVLCRARCDVPRRRVSLERVSARPRGVSDHRHAWRDHGGCDRAGVAVDL